MGTRFLLNLVLAGGALVLASNAKADLIFDGNVGGGSGECCFEVDLSQVSSTEVLVTVTLDGGAEYFVDTGSGQHPGFGFSITDSVTADPTITITSLSSPWVSGDVHLTSVTTGGPSYGVFDYYIDNPGSGASGKNTGPLSFDVTDSNGLSVSDFVGNGSGYYFVADILGSDGGTGLAGDSECTSGCGGGGGGGGGELPEPASVLLSMGGLGLIAGFVKCRKMIRP